MKLRASWVPALLLSCFCSLSSAADPDQRKPYPQAETRLFIGEDLGTNYGGPVWIDGRRVANEDGDFYFGLNAGIGHLIGRGPVGITTAAFFGTGMTSWSELRGESRTIFGLSVAPELRLDIEPGRPRRGIRLSIPVGPSFLKLSPGPERSIATTYSTGYGVHFGLAAGYDLAGPHHGAFADLSWVAHVIWVDSDIRLVSAPHTQIDQRLKFLNHVVMVTIGYLYWL